MENLTLTGLLKKSASEFPNRRALYVSGKLELSHVQLQEQAERAAALLVVTSVNHGDVVAPTFPNTVEINCAVIPREESKLNETEVLSYCKKNLASFKIPKKVFITDTLSKTATGKIQRRIVTQHFLAQISTAKGPKFGA